MKVRPFSGQSGFTVFDNVILDYIMPGLSNTAWKVLCYVIRKTIGWHKESDQLSYTRIMAGTGISSRSTISKALTDLEAKGFIIVTRSDDQETANSYQLNTALEIEVPDAPSPKNGLPPSPENGLPPSPKNGHTKERHTKQKLPTRVLVINAISEATGMSATLNYDEIAALADDLIASGYTYQQIAAVYAANGYWFKHDWRGKKGELPDFKAIRETIRRGVMWLEGSLPQSQASSNGRVDKQELAATVVGLVTEYRFYTDAKEHIPPDLLPVVDRMPDWSHLKRLSEKQIEIEFYRAYSQATEVAP